MRRRGLVRVLLWAGLVVALIVVYGQDSLFIAMPSRHLEKCGEQLAARLRRDRDLVSLLTFDEARPVDWAFHTNVYDVGTRRVAGRFGDARQFFAWDNAYIRLPESWLGLGNEYTIAFWLKPESRPMRQSVVVTDQGAFPSGFAICNSRLNFSVPGHRSVATLGFPITNFSTFVHLAGVVDLSNRVVRLYENGSLKGEARIDRVANPKRFIEIGKEHPLSQNKPMAGILDEFMIIKRALTEAEIRELATARRSRLVAWGGSHYRRLRLAELLQRTLRVVDKSVDLFNPFRSLARVSAEQAPPLVLQLSGDDTRHMRKNFEISRLRGHATGDADDLRRIAWVRDDGLQAAGLRLLVSDQGFTSRGRPSYVLELEGASRWRGLTHVRLRPPEDCGFVEGLLRDALTAEESGATHRAGLCTLVINGRPEGVYIYDDYAKAGAWSGCDPRQPREPENSSMTRAQALARYDATRSAVRSAFLNDPRSPLSAREIKEGLHQGRKRLGLSWPDRPPLNSELDRCAASLSLFSILGSNRAAFYITEPLALPDRLAPSIAVRWKTSQPGLIDSSGAVARPTGRPEGVRLEATLFDGSREMRRAFDLRVMPDAPKVPALFLYLSESCSPFTRVESVAELEDAAHPEMSGRRASRIKLRGKTGLRQDKKAYSIRFREAPCWVPGSKSRVVYLVSCYLDHSFLRNRFAYELFRSFGTEQEPRFSPRGRWVELFVNDRYFGLYEICERMDRDMLGWDPVEKDDDQQPVLYKIRDSSASFTQVVHRAYSVIEPPPEEYPELWSPLEELTRFVGAATPSEFAGQIGQRVDKKNLMDLFILLNVTGQFDGDAWNLGLARDRGGKFFFVPWDFDQSLMGIDARLHSNELIGRALRDDPEFLPGLKARYAALRGECLSDESLRQRVEKMARGLEGYAEWDLDLWRRPVTDYAFTVDYLQRALAMNMEFMDRTMHAWATDNLVQCP